MAIDPFRFAIATVPLIAYLLVLAVINLRRKPFLTTGSCDLATLGVALSGIVLIGPIELFRPEPATAQMGNFAWLLLLAFYWLWVWLFVLLARPRLVIYNASVEEVHPILASAAGDLDAEARWAGDCLTLPSLGVQLHIDSFPIMRNVSLASSGPKQNLQGWYQLSKALNAKLGALEVQSNPRCVSFFLLAFILTVATFARLLNNPVELAEGIRQVFVY